MKYDVIIVGAGAAGLMAAKDLLEAGYTVCVLEADQRAGGRIHSIQPDGFDQIIELGAEFVHGNLPLTLSLLQEAGIKYSEVGGKMINVRHGKENKVQPHGAHWNAFEKKLGELKNDTTIAAFLSAHFSGEKYESLRRSVQNFAEGFDLADINDASAQAAQREWSAEDEPQYRVDGGYTRLTDYLLKCCMQHQFSILFNQQVDTIHYDDDGIRTTTVNGDLFESNTIVLTVSAGILKSGRIHFSPALEPHYADAIQALGFGDVIKVLLQFSEAFWEDMDNDIGFILSDENIPTWWTQSPGSSTLFTGWLGGPRASVKSSDAPGKLLDEALVALSNIFKVSPASLKDKLRASRIECWKNHPYAMGGYSYMSLDTAAARKILLHPLAARVYFAGEALHQGESQGTVEAALQSGRHVAEQVRAAFPKAPANAAKPKTREA